MPRSTATPPQRPCQEARLALALGPVLLLTVIFFVHFLARQITGPLLPAMEGDLGLSHTQSGLFLLLMGIGFFFSQIGAAAIAGRWGYRWCILVSLGGSAFATALVGSAASVWLLGVGFLGLGMTGGLYVPAGIALITVLVRPRDWGKAMGIHELAPNLALISVPFLATLAVAWATWRWGFLGLSLVLAALAAVYFLFGVDGLQRPSPPDASRLKQIATTPAFWFLVILFSLAVGVETGVYSMIPLFLVNERGFSLADANQLLGISRIPGIAMVLLAGWITDRLSPATTVTIALAATGGAVVCIGAGPRHLLVPAIFAQAAAAACIFPPILSMASQIATDQDRTLTLSLILAVAPVIGSGLLPAGIALAGDLGSFAAGFVAAGILTLSGCAIVRRCG